MWLPRWACPECRGEVTGLAGEALVCRRCGARYPACRQLWRFLSVSRQQALAPFVRQYRAVREREGYRNGSGEFYRQLPWVPPYDAHATEWRIRQESFDHLRRDVLGHAGVLQILDLGAGTAWLSNRLASLGHRVVAVDIFDDEQDGLGAVRHYTTDFAAVQADFDALPFEPSQFDVVIFNGSLHYAPQTDVTLEHARTMLVPGGRLVVMDSPMFSSDRSGRTMLAEKHGRFASAYGLSDVVQPGVGYLTFAALAACAQRWHARGAFISTRGPLGWQVRRQIGRLRLRRAPAAFGVWVAR